MGENKTPEVVCAGILVADVISDILPHCPRPGELVLTDRILLAPGGLPVNAAVSLRRVGVSAGVVGKVGTDAFGDVVIDYLREQKVDVRAITRSTSAPTSQTMIVLTRSEDRRFIHCVGANAEFTVADIDVDYLKKARVFYVGGYFAMPRLDQPSLARLFADLQAHGVTTVLDVVAPDSGEDLFSQCRDLLRHTDVFLPNEIEAGIITGEAEPEAQAKRFLQCNPEMTVAITRGDKGVVVRRGDELVVASVYPVDVADQTGGGDAFDAGFMTGVLKEWDLERTVKFASALGASSVRAMGATTGVFTMDEALEFIAHHSLDLQHRHVSSS